MREMDKDGEVQDVRCLWSTLLHEVTDKASAGLSSSKNLVVFGDEKCGKSTLISRLQGSEDMKEGFGLEYLLIDIKDEARDAITNLSVCILDGNPVQSYLLKYVITEDTFDDQMALIVVSIGEPWKMIETLEKWADILAKHIDKLKLSEEKLKTRKSKILKEFYNYLEPEALSNPATNPVNLASFSFSSMSETSCETSPESPPAHTTNTYPEEIHEHNVMNNNLGVPLIVVVTKTDLMKTMVNEKEYTEEHFDFIQMHIRRFCLTYGAALFYVSVREDLNCDLLKSYIQHRLYGLPFNHSPYVVEGNCIFVPAGWDNHKKINILGENLTTINPESPYSAVVPRPIPRKTNNREPEIVPVDEQAFLLRLSMIKDQENIEPGMLKDLLGPSGPDSVLRQPGNTSKNVPVIKPADDGNRLTNSPTNMFRPKVPQGNSSLNLPNSGTSDGVLADFFSKLLKKRPTAGGTVGDAPTSSTSELQLSKVEEAKVLKETGETVDKINNNTPNIKGEDYTITQTQENQNGEYHKADEKINLRQNENKQQRENEKNKGEANNREEKEEKEYGNIIEEKIYEIQNENAPVVASSVKSSLGSTPDINGESMATDEISSLISEKAENSPEHSDSIADIKIDEISNNNTTDSGLKSQMDDIQLTRSADAPIVASSVKSSLGSTPDINVESMATDEISSLISEKAENSPEHSDSIADIKIDDISNNNTTDSGLKSQMDDIQLTRSADAPIVASSVKSSLGSTPDINVESMATDEISSLISEKAENSPEHSDSIADIKIDDISNNNTTDSGLKSQMDDIQLTRSADAPIVASSVKSSLGSTPDINVESMATDEISSLISEKAENSPEHSDSIADIKIDDISNNNTTDSGLKSQMDDIQLTRSADAPIVASSVKSSLGSTPDINVESMATDEISSLISEKAENSPEHSDSIADIKIDDISNNNTTDSGLKSQMDDIQLTRSADAPIVASSVKSSLGSTPDINVESMATDEISSLISEKAENSPEHSDSIADIKIDDISNNNTTDSGLKSQMDDIQLTRSADAPIVASSVKSSLGSTPDINVESMATDEISSLISEKAENSPEHSDSIADIKIDDISNNNTTDSGLKSQMDDIQLTRSADAPIVASSVKSSLGSTPDINVESMATDEISSLISEKAENSPEHSDSIADIKIDDISNNNTTDSGLKSQMDDIQLTRSADAPIVASSVKSSLGSTPDINVESMATDEISSLISEKAENSPEHSDSIADIKIDDISNNNTTDSGLKSQMDDIQLTRSADAPIVASSVKSSLGSTPDINVESMATDEISSLISEKAENSPEHSDSIADIKIDDISNNNTTDSGLKSQMDDIQLTRSADAPIVASSVKSSLGSTPDINVESMATDEISSLISEKAENSPEHSDSIADIKIDDISNNNTTDSGLKSQMDDIQLTRSADAPIVASSVKSSLGSTPDINVESMATDEISSLISEKAENSPEHSDSIADIKIDDISNNNTTDSGLKSQMDDIQLTRSADAPIVASSVKSSLGSTPDINVESMATDEISSLISEKAENSPEHSDSIADIKIDDISNNNTTDSGLKSQMDDIQLTRSADAPIVASSVKSSLGSTPDINVESMATDEISSLISEKAENSPEHSDSIADIKIDDISNNNTTDSGLKSQMDDIQLTRSADAPIVASSVKSSLGSTPDINVESMATDEISSLISEKAENSPEHSDSIADIKIDDISNNNTTDSGLKSQMDDIQLTRSADAPIVASSVKSSLGSTPDINVESMATDEISSLISEKAENSPEHSDSIADIKIDDISNNNTTDSGLKSQMDDIQLTRSADAPIVASSVKSSLGSTPDINVESMATDEISSLISEKAENSPEHSDSIADIKIDDISNNNTTDSGLKSQMDDIQLTRSADAPIVASSVKSSLGSTPDINVESMATDEISSLISEKAENSPEHSDSIADIKIDDISNNNTTDSGLKSQMDDIQLTRSADAPIVASSVKSSLGSTPDINVESMATDEISSLISEKAENSPEHSDSIADIKIDDISNNNTTDSGLKSQMDDIQLTRSADAPIVASSVKSSLGSTPDINVESMATDEISSLISEKAENSPEHSDSIADIKIDDISNNNTTDSGLKSQMDDIQLTRSADAPIVASSVKSSLGSTPDINVESMATDEISSLISEKAENSPEHSDSIADIKIDDISNNNTTDSGLKSQMDDIQLTRSADAPIVASSVKSSLGSTPDINVESMATDEISSLISEKAENSPEHSDSIADIKIDDISNNNTTDSGLKSQMDDIQLTRSADAPIVASSVKSSLGSTPDINVESMATDEISSLISEKAENSPEHSDSIADIKIDDISNNNTTDSGLKSQMDDIQLTRSADAPIVASSVKSSLGSTPDINVESMATDEISSLISEKAENSPEHSDSIADIKIDDISNNNTTDSGLKSQMDDIQLTRSVDAPIVASSVKSSLGSTPDINVESMATDEISSLISEKAENSPEHSDSIADIKIDDISNNNTTDSGLKSQMDDIQLTRSADAPIVASSVKSSLGSTPDINVESMATDEISSLISEKAENSPEHSDSIADIKIDDISNNNTTDSGLKSQMDDIQLTRSADAPIVASSVKSSLGSTPDINVESMATDEISSLISEKAENSPEHSDSIADIKIDDISNNNTTDSGLKSQMDDIQLTRSADAPIVASSVKSSLGSTPDINVESGAALNMSPLDPVFNDDVSLQCSGSDSGLSNADFAPAFSDGNSGVVSTLLGEDISVPLSTLSPSTGGTFSTSNLSMSSGLRTSNSSLAKKNVSKLPRSQMTPSALPSKRSSFKGSMEVLRVEPHASSPAQKFSSSPSSPNLSHRLAPNKRTSTTSSKLPVKSGLSSAQSNSSISTKSKLTMAASINSNASPNVSRKTSFGLTKGDT
ncbi:unnamed protein product [Trichobilharzia szidati]|nr:unnamed protein product [Trichobilharzia szidati]